jgi:hypothetical protein
MTRLVSFSLYGQLPIYTVGAIRNAELVREIYPGWTARYYVDESVSGDVLRALGERGAEVIKIATENRGPVYGRFWRLWVAADADVDRFIVRDVDSRLNSREKAAVDAWIASGAKFHIMRDSIHHSRLMLAGMWGGLGQCLPEIRRQVDNWGRYSAPGQCDQFMSEVIYPLTRHQSLCHDSFGHFDDGMPFPPHATMRETSYVGEIVRLDMIAIDVWRRLGEQLDKTAAVQRRLAQRERELKEANAKRSDLERRLAQRERELEEAKARRS